MPGKNINGTTTNQSISLKEGKSFCEGMGYRQADTGANAPITDNPHEAGSDCAVAWDNGWTVADDAEGGAISAAAAAQCALQGAAVTL